MLYLPVHTIQQWEQEGMPGPKPSACFLLLSGHCHSSRKHITQTHESLWIPQVIFPGLWVSSLVFFGMLWFLLKNIEVVGNHFNKRSSPFSCMSSAQRQQLLEENPKYFLGDTFLLCHCRGHWGNARALAQQPL